VGGNVECVVIVSDKQVKHAVACSACHCLDDLISGQRDSRVADSDCIEGLQVVRQVQGTTLLFDTEPAQSVGCVRVLVNAHGIFVFEDLYNFA
jgi:hypothetical protein